jgi:hypothetical protein
MIYVRTVSAIVVAGTTFGCLRVIEMAVVIHLMIPVAETVFFLALMVVRVRGVRIGVVLMLIVFLTII